MAGQLVNVHGEAQVWRVLEGNRLLLVWTVPGTDIPIVWEVPDLESRTAIFGPGQFNEDTSVDRRFATQAELDATGALDMGLTSELRNPKEHPWRTFLSTVEQEAKIAPWLTDPAYADEFLPLIAGAMFEGRTLLDSELRTTRWWRDHSEAEREWLEMYYGDPATAAATQNDRRLYIQDLFRQVGAINVPDTLLDLLTTRFTTGAWSQSEVIAQINKAVNPVYPGQLHPEVRAALTGQDPLSTFDTRKRDVGNLVRDWLGPYYGQWSESQKMNWAQRMAIDPNAQGQLEDMLSRQRLALFPEYEDSSLTYEDIVAPWRNRWSQLWGKVPDETDPLFTKAVRLNDAADFDQLLRVEGLKRGVRTVVHDFQTDALSAFSGMVRQIT